MVKFHSEKAGRLETHEGPALQSKSKGQRRTRHQFSAVRKEESLSLGSFVLLIVFS